MKRFNLILLSILFIFTIAGCGKDEKRDQEMQKAMERGANAERQMYEGVQKSIENMEKGVMPKQQEQENK